MANMKRFIASSNLPIKVAVSHHLSTALKFQNPNSPLQNIHFTSSKKMEAATRATANPKDLPVAGMTSNVMKQSALLEDNHLP